MQSVLAEVQVLMLWSKQIGVRCQYSFVHNFVGVEFVEIAAGWVCRILRRIVGSAPGLDSRQSIRVGHRKQVCSPDMSIEQNIHRRGWYDAVDRRIRCRIVTGPYQRHDQLPVATACPAASLLRERPCSGAMNPRQGKRLRHAGRSTRIGKM